MRDLDIPSVVAFLLLIILGCTAYIVIGMRKMESAKPVPSITNTFEFHGTPAQ